jgi:hypothetical protein
LPPPSDSNVKLIWSSLLKGGTVTGRKLFEDEHRPTVSDEIKALRQRDSIDAKKHMGMMNSRLKVLWDELKDGQKEWNDKAASFKASEKNNLLYRYTKCTAASLR